jgi:hypothetical protein
MPLLRATVSELVKGELSIAEACDRARESITGSPANVAGIHRRVLRSTGEIERDLADLTSWIAELSPADPEKWAATLLMLHVQLALDALPFAVRLATSVVQMSRGTCPPSSAKYALAIVETMLAYPDELTPEEVGLLQHGRDRFSRIAAGQDPNH